MTEAESPQAAGERIFREESGRIVATLIRVFGDFDLAEGGDARSLRQQQLAISP